MGDDSIPEHFPCYACGYDLKGLSASGKCPECGLLIRFTIEQDATNKYFRDQDESQKKYDEQVARTDRQQDEMDQQNRRIDQILDRWTHLQDRIEHLLDRFEDRM